jgi:hypothetical protein
LKSGKPGSGKFLLTELIIVEKEFPDYYVAVTDESRRPPRRSYGLGS